MTSQTGNKGFTLTELLVVVAIIIIIAATVVTVAPGLMENAKRKRAKVLLARVEIAIDGYYADYRSYPTTVDPLLTSLQPSGTNTKRYIEFKDSEIDDVNDYIIDAWGNPIVYDDTPTYNTGLYDLYSTGPDGVTATFGNDPDDINNWRQ